jgi:methyltransferase (TIGR00027 family)
MRDRDPKKMAAQIAGVRAAETYLPENERVFQDPYAEYFLGEDQRKDLHDLDKVRAGLAMYDEMMPGVNGAIVARIKYMDDCIVESIANGLKQVVIIGAGYDTRAHRLSDVKKNVTVFEVDHPETQKAKIDTIKTIFGHLPGHVVYVPVVLGVDRLDAKLIEYGYDQTVKTLFVIEGLLMYIPPPAVDHLLGFITSASGPESALVADNFSTSVVDGTSALPEARVLKQFVESEGASLQFGIDEEKTEAFFRDRGFGDVTCNNARSYKQRYFKGAGQDRAVSTMFNFVHAVVSNP